MTLDPRVVLAALCALGLAACGGQTRAKAREPAPKAAHPEPKKRAQPHAEAHAEPPMDRAGLMAKLKESKGAGIEAYAVDDNCIKPPDVAFVMTLPEGVSVEDTADGQLMFTDGVTQDKFDGFHHWATTRPLPPHRIVLFGRDSSAKHFVAVCAEKTPIIASSELTPVPSANKSDTILRIGATAMTRLKAHPGRIAVVLDANIVLVVHTASILKLHEPELRIRI
jgi:hypothetical protein